MSVRLRSPTLQDGVFLFVTGAVAIYGLHDSYAGWSYLLTGLIGLMLGIGLAFAVMRFGLPLIVLAGAVVLAFFLLGGLVALNGLGGSSLLPVPHTLGQLASTAVHGWKDVLTTLPPVNSGTLLVLPYLLGLVTGALGMAVAERSRRVAAPTVVTAALLVLVILLGVQHPSREAVDGALFAGFGLGWLILRARRTRPHYAVAGGLHASRRISGALLCVGVTVIAALIGTDLPGYGAGRTVLRSSVIPPFNVGQYPSPLAGFRRFTKGYTVLQPEDGLYNTPLFRVSGLPAGTPMRIATLDSYDGNVWGAGDVAGSVIASGPTDSDTFQKVGQVIDNPERGKSVTATVKILNSAFGVWLPEAGGLTGITFTQPDEQIASAGFRYNLATSTGVIPQGLGPGDSYTFHSVLPDSRLTSDTQLASGSLPEVASYTQFQQLATRWAGHASSPVQEIDAIASYLRANGHYTDGGVGAESFAAGHSLYRLSQFVSTSGELAGDDEQFSALMALMANEVGVPARVVVGAVVPADGTVTGRDIHAWIELQAADGAWMTLPQTAFMGTVPPKKQSEKSQPSVPTSAIPPPAPTQPPETAGEEFDSTPFHREQGSKVTHPVPKVVVDVVAYAGIPIGAIIAICALIVGVKVARRARRRRHGQPIKRLAFAWRELLDHARDFGHVAPPKATRREQAIALGLAGVVLSAAQLDSVMFGPQTPSEAAVDAYWSRTDELRRELAATHSRWRRVRAALNIVTLRPRRAPRR